MNIRTGAAPGIPYASGTLTNAANTARQRGPTALPFGPGPFIIAALLLGACVSRVGIAEAPPTPLQLSIQDPLGHEWKDELVHFDLRPPRGTRAVVLKGPNGTLLPSQLSDVRRTPAGEIASARIWTVTSVPANGAVTLRVEPVSAPQPARAAGASPRRVEGGWLLENGLVSLKIPELPGKLTEPRELAKLSPPLYSIRRGGERSVETGWLGQFNWQPGKGDLLVTEATTTVLERGPVRSRIRQRYRLADEAVYEATIELSDRQAVAIISERSNLGDPSAALRYATAPGFGADRVFWHNQWKAGARAGTWELRTTERKAAGDPLLCRLRPWTFWWKDEISPWAGFSRAGSSDCVGLLMLRPSRWLPSGWEGFDHSEVRVSSAAAGGIEVTLPLARYVKSPAQGQPEPIQREWAITVGDTELLQASGTESTSGLRRLLIKHSEFPLDEVKEMGLDAIPELGKGKHPSLLFSQADLDRARSQARRVPSVRAAVQASTGYIQGCGGVDRTLEREGWKGFMTRHYYGNYLLVKLPEAFVGSADPLYGRLMAATVQGLTQEVRDLFVEAPQRPSLGANGPWVSESITRLLFAYDLVAGTPFLSEADALAARRALAFSAQVLGHRDFWNPEHGLASSNPNMTSSIRLPRGLIGLALGGHPRAKSWLTDAESELQQELRDWVSPGGAWIEDPGYQAASLDGIFLLAQAIRRAGGKDYFADPNFRAMMEYYGALLTPPDPRFPWSRLGSDEPKSTLPSIGDMFSGFITGFNGWMAAATAEKDPAYSRRQQFYWKAQGGYTGSAGRAGGLTLALTNPELPEETPTTVSSGFPGFGAVLRGSWTDPRTTYIAHRTGPLNAHYHEDYGTIVLHALGVPLCVDFGNSYQPVRRDEPWYHSGVSWERGDVPRRWSSTGSLTEAHDLSEALSFSRGMTRGSAGQESERSILLVKGSPAGAPSYALMRDRTRDGQTSSSFYWNLWCLARELRVGSRAVVSPNGKPAAIPAGTTESSPAAPARYSFRGQLGVDLDVHVLSPARPAAETERWGWQQEIYVWDKFSEEQVLLRLAKSGSREDFFTLLWPRRETERTATVKEFAGGAGAVVNHAAGRDFVVLNPGSAVKVVEGDVQIEGTAVCIRLTGGEALLSMVRGGRAAARGWSLAATDAAASLRVSRQAAEGEYSGSGGTLSIGVPGGLKPKLRVDGKEQPVQLSSELLQIAMPKGNHRLALSW
jgi:hypothetical protein